MNHHWTICLLTILVQFLIFYSLSGDFSSGVSPDVSGDDEDDDESGGYPVSHFTTQPLVMWNSSPTPP